MTCTVKGCPAPEHTGSDWPRIAPHIGAVWETRDAAEEQDTENLIHAAPDMAHSLAGLVEAAERLAVEGRSCEFGTYVEIRTALKTALLAAEAALRKAGGR